MGKGISRAGFAVGVAITMAVLAAPAQAFMVEVRNDTANDVRFSPSSGVSCWDPSNRDFPTMTTLWNNPVIAAKSIGKFEAGGPSYGLEGGCLFKPGYRQISINFRNQAGEFKDPMAVGDAYPFGAPQIAFRDGKPGFENAFNHWLPANPEQSGANVGPGAGGGYCIVDRGTKTVASTKTAVTFTITDDLGRCNSSGSPRVVAAAGSARLEPIARVGDGPSRTKIVSMFDLGSVLCRKTLVGVSWERNCDDIANQAKWNLAKVDAEVRKWQLQNKVQPNIGWKQVGDGIVYPNNSDTAKEISVSLSITTGTRTQKDHCDGFKFGEKLETKAGGKIGLPFVTEGSVEVTVGFDAEQNWSDCNITETNGQTQQTITFPVTAKPHGVTSFRFLQGSADMKLNYTADLTFAKADTAQPLRTPLARGLALSSARVVPCVGTLVGGGDKPDPFSMLGIGKLMQSYGYSADSLKEFDPIRNTLAALPKFKQSAADRCPGWPSGYPASMVFEGDAGLSVNTLGAGAEDAPWAPGIGTVKPVDDFKPFATSRARAPGAAAARGAATGDDGQDVIVAGEDGVGDLLKGRGGTDVLEGDAGSQTMLGGGGLDVLTAGRGGDDLDGGPGSDSLYGEGGEDRLADDAGMNRLDGGDGEDVLKTSGRAIGGLAGGRGADRLVLDGDGPVSLDGDEGDDTYVLERGANAARVTEFPGEGEDTIIASGDIDVPPAVERVEAEPGSRVRITAGEDAQTLVGGDKSDDLSGGPGADVLRGGGGDDRISLEQWGFDTATGGPGADTFTPVATPLRQSLFDRGDLGGAPTAHRIRDLLAAEGDRLVLREASFGGAIESLDRRMIVRQGASPAPRGNRPQLLFDSDSSLLSFDRDGKGDSPPQVVAVLDGYDKLPVDAISIPSDAP